MTQKCRTLGGGGSLPLLQKTSQPLFEPFSHPPQALWDSGKVKLKCEERSPQNSSTFSAGTWRFWPPPPPPGNNWPSYWV